MLISSGSIRQLSANELLFARGDAPSGMYCVLAGTIRAGAVDRAGREVLLTIVEPYQWIGEISLFDGRPRTNDAVAEVDSRVFAVPQHALEAVLARTPRWWREFGRLACVKLRLTFAALEDLALMPIAARLARRLLVLAGDDLEGTAHFERRTIVVSQEQLALMLAVSRQTVNKELKRLEGDGLVAVRYHEIELRDVDALRTKSLVG